MAARAFSLVQLVLVNVMILLPLGYIQESMTYYGASVVLALVGFAVDLLLFEAMGRFAQKRRDDVRATMLEEQLDRYLARCGEFVSDIEHTLKVRHDMGNHVQVVLALSERGNFKRPTNILPAWPRCLTIPAEARSSLMIVRMIIAVGVLLLMCAIMAVLARRLRGVPRRVF